MDRWVRGDVGAGEAPAHATMSEGMTTPPTSPTSSGQPRQPRLRSLLWADFKRGAGAALLGCGAFALVEFVATLWTHSQPVDFVTALRFAMLTVTLAMLAWLVLAPLLGGVAIATRLALMTRSAERGRAWRGLFAAARPGDGAGTAAGWAWALGLAALVYIALSTYVSIKAMQRFKEPQITAMLLSLTQLGLVAVSGALAYGLSLGFIRLGRLLDARLGRFNPFGRLAPALAIMVLVGIACVRLALTRVPQLGPLVPWRHVLALVAIGAGAWFATVLYRLRGGILPTAPRRRKIAAGASLFAATLIIPVTLVRVGADPDAKYLAITSSPSLSRLVDMVRKANDFDGDGFGSLLGEKDCAPFNDKIRPGARDIPDNGIDENCDGRDFSMSRLKAFKKGQPSPVPEEFAKTPYNILLITIDTVRYDHTGFGGYLKKSKRNTTPNLDKLVARSTSFSFANAPSAGTMASVPAILTSKFFHSGVALDEKNIKRGMPPRLAPKNVLISEVLKRGGYRTGAILTHEYFNDWGMKQGFDYYDNELGAKHNPRSITSAGVTDRAIAWIAKNNRRKWFLWTHYLDPHGRYVAHPDKSFGTSEKDLYDGELHFTDRHIGRLLEELQRIPRGDRTIIIVTSDHGDAFKEHGFINHGQALYRELLHVPLIIYVPNLPPRVVGGAVSPLDVLPTAAALANVDVKDLSFEGESLVPQLFYGQTDLDRVVFSETNWPRPLRAAISSKYKLVYNMQNNLYELYDLKRDPWEKRNIATSNRAVKDRMASTLNLWLERVFFTRDPTTNQAAMHRAKYLLKGPPKVANPVKGLTYDGGRIELLGFDTKKTSHAPGERLPVWLYFHVKDAPTADFRFQVQVVMEGDQGAIGAPLRTRPALTDKGVFATSRWRKGEYIRDRAVVQLPHSWRGGHTLAFGFRMLDAQRRGIKPTGPTLGKDLTLGLMGRLPFRSPPALPTQRPKPVAPSKPGRPRGK